MELFDLKNCLFLLSTSTIYFLGRAHRTKNLSVFCQNEHIKFYLNIGIQRMNNKINFYYRKLPNRLLQYN